jgi:hypothetical protein
VTRTTSSRSAKATPRTDDAQASSGTLPTDPLSVSTFDAMQEARGADQVTMTDLRYAVWNLLGRAKHLLGLHTFVILEEWDLQQGSMRVIGMVCWHCPEKQ